MRNKKFYFFIGLGLSLFLIFVNTTLAHQPRIVDSNFITVIDPEISKAYYGELKGEAHTYEIKSDKPFKLFVGILVPDIVGQKKNISVEILQDGGTLAFLNAETFEWKKYFEEFGQSSYWQGPEYKAEVTAGQYTLKVSSPENIGRYSLAVGETEFFDKNEGMSAIKMIPNLKLNFFNESPITFIFSPFGWGYILAIYIVAFFLVLICRFIVRKVSRKIERKVARNINKQYRLIPLALSLLLLLFAITTSWSAIIILLSGFAFFETVFGWSLISTIIGKNNYKLK